MRITIDYEPTPKGVPRTRYVNGRVLTYYNHTTTDGLKALRELLTVKHLKPFPEHMPVRIDVIFWRTKSKWYRPKSEKLPCRKPDLDNFLKWCIDGLSGIVFPDDAQVTTINARKRWSKNGHGHVEIKLMEDTDA